MMAAPSLRPRCERDSAYLPRLVAFAAVAVAPASLEALLVLLHAFLGRDHPGVRRLDAARSAAAAPRTEASSTWTPSS